MMDNKTIRQAALFVGGVLFGTAGVKILGSSEAKKLYTNCVAAGLRAKDCVMNTAAIIQENAEDIVAEAKEMNRSRDEECFEDEVDTEEETDTEAETKES